MGKGRGRRNVRPKRRQTELENILFRRAIKQHSYVNHTLAFLSLLAWRESLSFDFLFVLLFSSWKQYTRGSLHRAPNPTRHVLKDNTKEQEPASFMEVR